MPNQEGGGERSALGVHRREGTHGVDQWRTDSVASRVRSSSIQYTSKSIVGLQRRVDVFVEETHWRVRSDVVTDLNAQAEPTRGGKAECASCLLARCSCVTTRLPRDHRPRSSRKLH
jgi:hypothetical protein